MRFLSQRVSEQENQTSQEEKHRKGMTKGMAFRGGTVNPETA